MANKKINKDKDFLVKSIAQRQMMEADFDNVHEVLLTGPGGTGKTISLIVSSMGPQRDGSFLVDNKDYVGLILRREGTQLEKSGLIRNALEWYRKFYPTLDYNGSLKRVTFPSGAVINFGGCESEQDCYKYKGFSKLHFLGLEEGTQWTQLQIDILTTRLRDANNTMPLRVRISTNAGENEEPLLNRYKYWLWQSSVEPLNTDLKVEYGSRLYRYVDEQDPNMPLLVTTERPKGFYEVFQCIETKINDIMENNRQVQGKITDPVIREQLMNHKWGLKIGSGHYFSITDFTETYIKPHPSIKIRYWDSAASGPKGDYLAGALISHTIENGISKFCIEDMILLKAEPGDVIDIIKKTAFQDGKSTYIAMEQEPASHSKVLIDLYQKDLKALGFTMLVDVKKDSKQVRAQFASPIAKENRISFIRGPMTDEMLKQLVNFPTKGIHDDAVDSCTGALFFLINKLPKPIMIPRAKKTEEYNFKSMHTIPTIFRR